MAGRFGNRKIQTPGYDWRKMYGGDPRKQVHNPPKPGERGGVVGKVKKYFSRYMGGGSSGGQASSGYLRSKKETQRRIKRALGED